MAEALKSQQMGLLPDGNGPGERSVGRPRGSLNRRSRDWQAWLAASGKQHPLEFLLEVMTATPEQLVDKYTGLKGEDVLGHKIRAAVEALPYLEQKLPTAVEDVSEGKTRTVLVIGQMTGQQAQSMSQRFGFHLKENQGVIDVSPQQSDDAKSDATANVLKVQDNDE